LPARNIHHGIRLAASLGLDLNLFVSLNFSLTTCPAERACDAFAQVRALFGKWVTRPPRTMHLHQAPPTFVWVIENSEGCLNAHWLVHVPQARQKEFAAKLDAWFGAAVGDVHSDRAIHIRPAPQPMAAGRYMLKGMHPALARRFNIEHVYQGWVFGKRVGHSKNVGPGQVAEMRRQGRYRPARRWVPGRWK
jgi:hypothetical protein